MVPATPANRTRDIAASWAIPEAGDITRAAAFAIRALAARFLSRQVIEPGLNFQTGASTRPLRLLDAVFHKRRQPFGDDANPMGIRMNAILQHQ